VDIDTALADSATKLRGIARTHRLSEDAVFRHKTAHLPAALSKAQEVEEVARADNLLDRVENLQARTLAILETAEETDELRTALGAIREARSNVELLAKLLGELDERPVANVVLIAPEVRAVIVRALEPFPAARVAVAAALGELQERRSNGHA
jgi:hypothetical protein